MVFSELVLRKREEGKLGFVSPLHQTREYSLVCREFFQNKKTGPLCEGREKNEKNQNQIRDGWIPVRSWPDRKNGHLEASVQEGQTRTGKSYHPCGTRRIARIFGSVAWSHAPTFFRIQIFQMWIQTESFVF